MSFRSTSPELPSVLHVSFANYGKKAQLGAQLVNCDSTGPLKDGETYDKYMFTPGYAVVSKLIGGDTSVAKKSGVEKGDVIIAINGLGFRRFEQDYKDDQVTIIQTHGAGAKRPSTKKRDAGGEKTKEGDDDEEDFHDAKNKDGSTNEEENEDEFDDIETEDDMDVLMVNHRVVPAGNAYKELLSKIKSVKAANGDPPLIITFERYGWDHRPNCWNRFLTARNNNVINAMQLLQEHELWKRRTFPIDLVTRGMQKIVREKIISEIDVGDVVYEDEEHEDDDENNIDVIKNTTKTNDNKNIVKPTDCPSTVYVNYAKVMQLYQDDYLPMEEIIQCFVIFIERQLGNVNGTNQRYDVRSPKVNQFIDVTDCTFSGSASFRVDVLKQLYNTFEPNYPETLNKLVIYPVSTMFGVTIRTMLSFVNDKTRKKFVITNDLKHVCNELGWNQADVEECGSIQEFMYKHEKAGRILYYD